MRRHASGKRLLGAADSDDLILTTEEFNHLKTCPECFTAWIEFIYQSMEEQMDGQLA
jgi:hypothetical protein